MTSEFAKQEQSHVDIVKLLLEHDVNLEKANDVCFSVCCGQCVSDEVRSILIDRKATLR